LSYNWRGKSKLGWSYW